MHARAIVRAALAVLAMLAVLPAGAASRTVASAGPGLLGGPTLAGTGVIWGEGKCVRRLSFCDPEASIVRYEINRARDGKRQILARGSLESSGLSGQAVDFASSPNSFALVRSDLSFGPLASFDQHRLAARRGDGRLQPLSSCSGFGAFGFDLVNDLVAYRRCPGMTDRVSVTDLNSSERRDLVQAERVQVTTIRVAGRYVAYQRFTSPFTEGEVVVQDWSTGAVAYIVPGIVEGLAVSPDGTLAVTNGTFACGDKSRATVSWYSVAAPTAHTTPVESCSQEIELVGGEILYFGADFRQGGFPARRKTSIEALGLDGARRTVVDRGQVEMTGRLDADARSVAFGVRSCRGTYALEIASVRLSTVKGLPESCPVRAGPRLGLRGRGAVLSLLCPRGCAGTLALRAGGSFVARRGFTAPQGRARLSVRLSARAVRTLRKTRSAVLVVKPVTRNRGDGTPVRRTLRVLARRL